MSQIPALQMNHAITLVLIEALLGVTPHHARLTVYAKMQNLDQQGPFLPIFRVVATQQMPANRQLKPLFQSNATVR